MAAHQLRQPLLGHGLSVGPGIAIKFRREVMGGQQSHVQAPASLLQLGIGGREA